MYICTLILARQAVTSLAFEQFVIESIELFAAGEVNCNRAAALRHFTDVDRGAQRAAELLLERNQMFTTGPITGLCGCLGLTQTVWIVFVAYAFCNQTFGRPHAELFTANLPRKF